MKNNPEIQGSLESVFEVGNGTTLVQLLENHTKVVLRSIDNDGGVIPDKPDTVLMFTNQRQAQAVFWALTTQFPSQLVDDRSQYLDWQRDDE